MNEMDEMRQQMAILKEKLKEQEIVNDQLLRNAISSKMRSIKKDRWIKRIIIIFGLIYCPWMMNSLFDFPTWFIIATIALFLVALAYEEIFSEGTTSEDLSKKGLLQTSKKLSRMRKMNARWLWFGIPTAILWVFGFTWFILQSEELSPSESKGIFIGIATGFAIGLLLGLRIFIRQQRNAKELIDDIDDIDQQ